MKTCVIIPGTWSYPPPRWQGTPYGLLADAADRLDETWYKPTLEYPQAYGDPVSYVRSVADGVVALREFLMVSTGPIAVIGHSQGSTVAGNMAYDLGHGRYPHFDLDRVIAFVLLADPLRDEGDSANPDPGGYGISGRRGGFGALQGRVFELAAPGDVICAARPDSMLRDLADFTSSYSLHDPEAWAADLVHRLRTDGWQNHAQHVWDLPKTWLRFRQAVGDAENFIEHHRHSVYPIENIKGSNVTYTAWAAKKINALGAGRGDAGPGSGSGPIARPA